VEDAAAACPWSHGTIRRGVVDRSWIHACCVDLVVLPIALEEIGRLEEPLRRNLLHLALNGGHVRIQLRHHHP
ncbi:MAG: hypothetical protein RL096_718, partial [Actinomycetota bacterium]